MDQFYTASEKTTCHKVKRMESVTGFSCEIITSLKDQLFKIGPTNTNINSIYSTPSTYSISNLLRIMLKKKI